MNDLDLITTGVLDQNVSKKPTSKLAASKSSPQLKSPNKTPDYSISSTIANKKRPQTNFKRLTRQQSTGFPDVPYSQLNPRAFSRRHSAMVEFINNGPYTTKNYKIDKMRVLRSAFAKDVSIIYDENASRLDKIRSILLSQQWNLIIILLIILDWMVAVCALLVDIYEEHTTFEELAKFFSIGLLSFFILEIFLKAVLLPGVFFRSKLELFDMFIVLVSFTFEAIMITKNLDFAGVSSILTMLRLWRILRLINRIMIAIETNIFEELNAIREDIIAMLLDNQKLRTDLEGLVMINMISKSFHTQISEPPKSSPV